MTSAIRAEAFISINESPSESHEWSIASGTRSLILKFVSPFGENHDLASLGAVITTMDGAALRLGDVDRRVELRFWADEAELLVRPGARFVVWYVRPIGRGWIHETLGDLD